MGMPEFPLVPLRVFAANRKVAYRDSGTATKNVTGMASWDKNGSTRLSRDTILANVAEQSGT